MQRTDSESKFIGNRCHICTGCGRCAPVGTGGGGLQVVTAQKLQREQIPIESSRGERLVTADIGTTTIAMQLYGADGSVAADHISVNPQTAYGADVLSRIQAAQEAGAALHMRRMVQEVLEAGLAKFSGCLNHGEHMRMVLAGNTTMIYLLCGYDPAELGRAPFHASHLDEVHCEIAGVPCTVFPGLSAFVGGDITAGIYACGMADGEELTLLIDLGTNGEMVLGNRERRIACATAAGPAFEGGVNRGIWGADMVSLLARLCREGIVDETGLLADEYFDEGVRIGDVCVTQASIRAIQLAKAAIRAGIDILMREFGIAGEWAKIRRVVLSGGFGYYLDPQDASEIGLLPTELAKRTVTGGNTALAGALRLGREVLSAREESAENQGGQARSVPDRILDVQILNLAEQSDFEERYIEYMSFKKEKKMV